MRMVLRDELADAYKSVLGTERYTVDGEIEGNDLLAGLRSREVVRR